MCCSDRDVINNSRISKLSFEIFINHSAHQVMNVEYPELLEGRSDWRILRDGKYIVKNMLKSQGFRWSAGSKGHHDEWGGCN